MQHLYHLLLIALGLGLASAASAQDRFDLPTRPGVTQSVYLYAAQHPVASVVLFPGGSGVVSAVHNNFLIRVAGRFAAAGVSAAVADVPSDHRNGIESGFAIGADHATDTAAIVAFLHSRAAVPVWLVGTSRGSISAAATAVQLGPPLIAGVVLTSSVWLGGMAAVPIGSIRVPVLIVHNRDDGCSASPFAHAELALAALTAAPARQLIAVAGGTARSGPCDALSPHGYFGIEDQVVPPVIAWIEAHQPP